MLDPDALADHLDALYRAAWALCGSREDAEDLVQETCARVLARPRIVRETDPRPYLLQVLRNTFASTLRTRSRRPVTVAMPAGGAEPVAAAPGPEDALAVREVFTAIATLPPGQRDAVVAVDVVGLRYAEAARALRVPVGTIMSRLARGRLRVAIAVDAR